MPIPEGAELALIPCRRCTREHFLYVDRDTRQVLDYDRARAPVRDGESLPAALFRLFNAPCARLRRTVASGTWTGTSCPPAPGRPQASPAKICLCDRDL